MEIMDKSFYEAIFKNYKQPNGDIRDITLTGKTREELIMKVGLYFRLNDELECHHISKIDITSGIIRELMEIK
jgi:hypothetical protein